MCSLLSFFTCGHCPGALPEVPFCLTQFRSALLFCKFGLSLTRTFVLEIILETCDFTTLTSLYLVYLHSHFMLLILHLFLQSRLGLQCVRETLQPTLFPYTALLSKGCSPWPASAQESEVLVNVLPAALGFQGAQEPTGPVRAHSHGCGQ